MLTDRLYKVLSQSETEARIILSDESHPVFQAHFPKNPILPGFMHFEIVSELFNLEITGVKKAKFKDLILPSQELLYLKNNDKLSVIVKDKEVASFSIV